MARLTNGGIIGKPITDPTQLSAIGKWNLSDQNIYKQQNKWVTDLVVSGLVLHLDAGNTSSYSGSGSTWYDLSGSNYHATFQNSPTWSSSNGGQMVMTGSQYFSTSFPLAAPSSSSLQSYCGWFVGNGNFFGSSAGGTSQFHFQISLSGTNLTYNVTYYGGSGSEGVTSATVTPQSINHIAVVKTAAYYYDVYFNGTKVMNQAYKTATTGTSFYPGLFYSGSYNNHTVSSYQIYNRTLSAAEVQQNYNAGKGRFGL